MYASKSNLELQSSRAESSKSSPFGSAPPPAAACTMANCCACGVRGEASDAAEEPPKPALLLKVEEPLEGGRRSGRPAGGGPPGGLGSKGCCCELAKPSLERPPSVSWAASMPLSLAPLLAMPPGPAGAPTAKRPAATRDRLAACGGGARRVGWASRGVTTEVAALSTSMPYIFLIQSMVRAFLFFSTSCRLWIREWWKFLIGLLAVVFSTSSTYLSLPGTSRVANARQPLFSRRSYQPSGELPLPNKRSPA
mmetsp:Transcript_71178/g.204101  ORF Transcript_71178/g.204101 Transcript_71178/m.204101 type:complete len:252 (+) Transcript_71178:195-950(+)